MWFNIKVQFQRIIQEGKTIIKIPMMFIKIKKCIIDHKQLMDLKEFPL